MYIKKRIKEVGKCTCKESSNEQGEPEYKKRWNELVKCVCKEVARNYSSVQARNEAKKREERKEARN